MAEHGHPPDCDRRDTRLVVEAAFWLVVARIALRSLSFAQLAKVLAVQNGVASARTTQTEDATKVGRAVTAAARRAPWRALCFERGLAACALLRMRGHGPTLYFGANNKDPNGPVAHVWVRLGGLDVVGCAEAEDFALLATFPTHPRQQGGP